MDWYDYWGWLVALFSGFLGVTFLWTCWREREWKALRRGVLLIGLPWLGWIAFLWWSPAWRAPLLLGAVALFATMLALFVLPARRKQPHLYSASHERIDERDIIFARMRYLPSSPQYIDYYSRHPECQESDDRLRAMPKLCAPGSTMYDALNSPVADACFEWLADLIPTRDGMVNSERKQVDPARMTRRLKGLAAHWGAVKVGVAELDPAYVYSHVGRGPGGYGEEVILNHKYAIVFAVEMNRMMVKQAPRTATVIESATQYVEAAKIAFLLANYVRSLGYPARAHTDANYRVVCPPIAVDAGLGEIGRNGFLMTQDYGPRIRLGVVTTDIPLVPDQPMDYAMQDFCQRCVKCAENCPSGAIPKGGKTLVRGVEKWLVDADKCYSYWRKLGTDCAICMNVCPYSKGRGLIHDAVRWSCSRPAIAQPLIVWADNVFYGRRRQPPQDLPQWMK